MGPESLIALPAADPRVSLSQPLDKRHPVATGVSDCRMDSDRVFGSGAHMEMPALYQDGLATSYLPGLPPAWNTHQDPTGPLSSTSQERDLFRRLDNRKPLPSPPAARVVDRFLGSQTVTRPCPRDVHHSTSSRRPSGIPFSFRTPKLRLPLPVPPQLCVSPAAHPGTARKRRTGPRNKASSAPSRCTPPGFWRATTLNNG